MNETTTITIGSQNKIQMIKAVRAVYGCGLKDAKEIVDGFHDDAIRSAKITKVRNDLANAILMAREAGMTGAEIKAMVGAY